MRRADSADTDPPGRVTELLDQHRVRVAWACGDLTTTDPAALRAIARPHGVTAPR